MRRPKSATPQTGRTAIATTTPTATTTAIGVGVAAVAAVAAVAGARLVARRRGSQANTPGRAGGPGQAVTVATVAARRRRLAAVGARAGVDWAGHRARRVFASAERRQELDTEFELRTAEQVAATLGEMKGALMKLGQMASYLDQGLPEHVRDALASLQSNAPPMSAELAAGVIRTELGHDPDDLFDTWDPTPIASASIGQVHRAITRDGEAVAVKVQYPGVAEAMAADLANLGLVFGGMGQLFPGFDPKPVVAELRERLTEELDYANEAVNQERFAEEYDGHPFIHVPRVLGHLSTSRVLTTELAEGVSFAEMTSWSAAERDLAAETIYRFAFGSLYRLRMFNGDPHPGNYLFRPGGQVTFLDFGLVKHFTPAELLPFEEMITAMVIDPDPAEFRRIVERVGLLPADQPFPDEDIADYFGHFYELVRHPGPQTITAAYTSESVRRYFDQRGPYGPIMRAVNLPASFVIIQRINLGLYALFGDMEATGDWRRLAEELWPFVEAGPSTDMGRTIAAWERTRS
jgi:predicted unusual protein kinase regulating ubiquinone biosynthesis (AarF/ABC1/UbiB family)